MSDAYSKRTYGGKEVGFGSKPAIAVVDFQRGYIDDKFAMGGSALVDGAVENSAKLLKLARSKNIPVATCAMAFQSEADMPHWKIPAMYNGDFFHGSDAVELDPRIYDPDYDFLVYKYAPSIFFSSAVPTFFNKHGVDTVIVCGCITSGCVRASVVDSFSYGWRTIVPEECVGDVEQAPHDANLQDIQRRYADVLPLQNVMDYLEGF
ncbi:MAG: isochorismatase family protein [Gammaproteobacteria bacterium]|jgi:maleamate amidohydrolase|nr:isochorismatase family protein [Gammaproteobacteria bacterium]